MAKKIGLILCGLGRMGMIHFSNILKNRTVELLYIIEMDLQKAQKVISDHGLTTTEAVHVDNAKETINKERVDGVIIATPTDTHEKLVLQTLEAGKHVLCEKPLSFEFDAAVKCYKIAEAKSLVLLCAFNRRFDPQIRKMHSNLSHIGKLHSIKICSRDAPRPPLSYLKISGGIFHDCIVHDMDMLRYLTGENPSTVYTLAHCHDPEIAELKDVDTVFVVLQFPSGVIAHIDVSRECVYGYHQTVQVYGDKGSMMSDNPRQSGVMLNGGQRSDDIFFSFHDRYAVAYSLELEHFFKLIKGEEKECDIKAKDTLQATILSQAAEDSFKNGCVINYSEYTKHKFSNIGI